MVSDYEIIKPWLDILMERLDKKISKMKIGYSDSLRRSIKGEIIRVASGNTERIKFMYLYYGTFVDMGVGKGQKLGEVRENKKVNRLIGEKGI